MLGFTLIAVWLLYKSYKRKVVILFYVVIELCRGVFGSMEIDLGTRQELEFRDEFTG